MCHWSLITRSHVCYWGKSANKERQNGGDGLAEHHTKRAPVPQSYSGPRAHFLILRSFSRPLPLAPPRPDSCETTYARYPYIATLYDYLIRVSAESISDGWRLETGDKTGTVYTTATCTHKQPHSPTKTYCTIEWT